MPTRAPTRSPTLKSIPLRLDLGQLGLCLYRGNDASSRLGRSRSNAFTLLYVFKSPATAATARLQSHHRNSRATTAAAPSPCPGRDGQGPACPAMPTQELAEAGWDGQTAADHDFARNCVTKCKITPQIAWLAIAQLVLQAAQTQTSLGGGGGGGGERAKAEKALGSGSPIPGAASLPSPATAWRH